MGKAQSGPCCARRRLCCTAQTAPPSLDAAESHSKLTMSVLQATYRQPEEEVQFSFKLDTGAAVGV